MDEHFSKSHSTVLSCKYLKSVGHYSFIENNEVGIEFGRLWTALGILTMTNCVCLVNINSKPMAIALFISFQFLIICTYAL